MTHQQETSSQSVTDSNISHQSWWRKSRPLGFLLTLALIVGLTFLAFSPTQAQSVSWQWYQADTHTHSAVSSDAFVDLGIISQATNFGYDALFLSDHNGASSFHVNNLTANHMAFEDNYTRWEVDTYGDPINPTNQLVTSPVNTEDYSLHLKSSANSEYGETNIWTKRGPNRLSDDIILKVSIYPTQIDADSGVYLSASFGGDPTVIKSSAYGYTTEAGVISPGKSTVLVWQLGDARSPSSDPNERVIVYPLSYTLNSWNHYTINVSDAIDDIPAADLPLNYNGLLHLKMAAGADNNGTAEAYFDTYTIDAFDPSSPPSLSDPLHPANEYVNRTAFVDDFNTSNFKVFPSYEMGQQRHTNRFNFGITNIADYRSYLFGTDGIPETHDSGYPAQLNHPDTTVTVPDVIANLAYGADFMEVREDEWLETWDDLLNEGALVLGTWTSDGHRGLDEGRAATQIYATGLDFDPLIRSLYEGRSYMARNNFNGRTILNLDSNSSEPYPARYPIYHSAAQSSADVHLLVTDDLGTNYTVTWIRNGDPLAVVTTSGDSHEETRSIPLGAQPWTFIRTEVRRPTGSLRAVTQPLFFVAVPDLPVDKQFHIDSITTANGRDYNSQKSKGITSSSWSTLYDMLYIALENPADALVDLRLTSNEAPEHIKLDGTELDEATSLANFEAATSSLWYYDSAEHLLYLKALHASEQAALLLEFDTTGDTTAPSIPTNLSAEPVHLGRIDLTWTESTDDFLVESYNIYRDGAFVATTQGSSYSDVSVSASTSYSYAVRALDVSGNMSALSSSVSETTPSTGTFTYTSIADTYADETNSTQNYGNSSALRIKADSPERKSYLRFDVQEMVGTVSNATLWLYANNNNPIGIDVHGVSDNSWEEHEINYLNAPPLGSIVESSGAFSGNSWILLDVTSLVSGNGVVNLGLSTLRTTNTSLASRETGANAPKLVIETNAGGSPPTITPTPTPTVTVTPTSTPTQTPGGDSITLPIHTDAYVRSNVPNKNYGSSTSIRTDASPELNSYLRFDLTSYTGSVTQATLRVFANSSSSVGYDVRGVSDNSWQELSITYNNAPSFAGVTSSSGSFSGGTWTEVDVTSLVTAGQEVNFALTTSGNTAMNLSSREGSNPSELIVEGQNLRQVAPIKPAPPFGPSILDEFLYLPLIER